MREVKHGHFTPLVFTSTGGMGDQGGDTPCTPLYLVQLSSSTVKIPVKSQTNKSGQVKGQIVIIKVQ